MAKATTKAKAKTTGSKTARFKATDKKAASKKATGPRSTGAIAFIGGGNMAEAIVRGLLGAGYAPARIRVAEPMAKRRSFMAKRYGIKTTADNRAAVRGADQIVLAVKPQIMDDVLAGLAEEVAAKQVVISIAAGIPIKRIAAGLGGSARVVRVMPNTPCLVGLGASVLCGGGRATKADVARARELFTTVGEAFVVTTEKTLDAVTGLSGSGPAYVYLFAEGLIRGGVAAGLDEAMAEKLAYQTLAGAAQMLKTTGQSPADLRKAVSSPGGTTLAGLAHLTEGRFPQVVAGAVRKATRRSKELGRA